MRLLLDANVLFTAAYSPDGTSRALFDLAASGKCTLSTSAFALDEARRNLVFKAPEKAPQLAELVARLGLVPEPAPEALERARQTQLAPKDAPILGAAIASGADILVTGDRRHFGPLFGKRVEGVRVLTPRAALEDVLGAEDP